MAVSDVNASKLVTKFECKEFRWILQDTNSKRNLRSYLWVIETFYWGGPILRDFRKLEMEYTYLERKHVRFIANLNQK